jgi:hypothetical protein
MAQMRVRDQDLLITQVKDKVNAKGLEDLQNNKKVQRITNELEARIAKVKSLVMSRNDLDKEIRKLKDYMEEAVSKFQKEHGYDDDGYGYAPYFRGIDFNANKYNREAPKYKLTWNMSREDVQALETKVRLQTMGTDFDVYKLIEELTAEFSS